MLEFNNRSQSMGHGQDMFSLMMNIPFIAVGFLFAYIIPSIAIYGVYKYKKNNPQKILELKQERKDFISNITSKSVKAEYSDYTDTIDVACYECGTYIAIKDKFCPNCGDNTQEELSDIPT